MDLDRQERAALARFFAKRFPTDDARIALAREAGLPVLSSPATSVVTAWERMLDDAEARHRLGHLGRAAARRDPADANLQRAARLLAVGEPRLRGPALAAVAVAVPLCAVALVVATAWMAGSFEPASAVAAAPETVGTPAGLAVAPDVLADAAPTTLDAAGGDEAEGSDVAPATPVAEVPPSGGAALATDAELATGAEPAHGAPPRPARTVANAGSRALPAASSVEPANHAGRCTQSGGGLVGYWWAGSEAPGAVGDVVVAPRDLNVRAWAPHAGNGFDLSGPVRCVLAQGDRVRLSHAPVEVPGDAVWVPLYSGDVLSGP